MAYSNFTKKDLQTKFGVKFRNSNLFPDILTVEPSEWLISALKKGEILGVSNEKSRSERIVTPILLEIASLNKSLTDKDSFAIISGVNLDIDASLGLNGECDFMFSLGGSQEILAPPIICITEAKNQDLEAGMIQASAQVVGAKKFNEMENFPLETLYGASTTGDVWRFLKYENNEITFDKKRYYTDNLSKLLGILQYIIESAANKVFSNINNA